MCEPLGTYLRHKTEIDQQSKPTNKESLRPPRNESKQKKRGDTDNIYTSGLRRCIGLLCSIPLKWF